MKDIVIKGRSIRRELIVLAICFVAVNLWNVYAILSYGTSWNELYKVWYAVLAVTIVLYIVLIPIRFLFCWLGRLVKRAVCRKGCGASGGGGKE